MDGKGLLGFADSLMSDKGARRQAVSQEWSVDVVLGPGNNSHREKDR